MPRITSIRETARSTSFIEDQAARTPGAVAILCEGRSVSYAQLNRKPIRSPDICAGSAQGRTSLSVCAWSAARG